MTRVIGVVGGSGGVGASTFAAVLAAVAGTSLLVDLDGAAGGVDVLLGVESQGGARWSGLRLAGGRLAAADLLGGLPRWGRCAVLAADVSSVEPESVLQVLDAATDGAGLDAVVLDLPRVQCAERAAALLRCEFVVVLARCDVTGLVAAHATVTGLPEVPLGLVARRGELRAEDAATLVAAPLLGTLAPLGNPLAPLAPRRLPRATVRVAAGVLAGLRGPVAVPA